MEAAEVEARIKDLMGQSAPEDIGFQDRIMVGKGAAATKFHLDELHDVLDHRRRIPERLQALLRHPSAEHLVVMELHTFRRDLPSAGLAYVVQEGSEAQREVTLVTRLDDREGVMQNVLVAVDGILLELQAGELGQELLGEAGVDDELQPLRGGAAQQQLGQLVRDPLRGDDGNPAVHPADRLDDAWRRRGVELRCEPSHAQHPQRIVRERDLRIERRVEPPSREVLHATERIYELALGHAHGHRVHREVAAGQVGEHVLAEGDGGLAVLLGVHLLAEGGDLEDAAALAGPYRAVPHADEILSVRPTSEELRRLPRQRVGREVEVPLDLGPLAPEQQIAHDAPNQVQLVAGQAEAFAQLGGDGRDLEERAGVRTRGTGHDACRIPPLPRAPAVRSPRAHRARPTGEPD